MVNDPKGEEKRVHVDKYIELLELLFEEQRKFIHELRDENKALKDIIENLQKRLADELYLQERRNEPIRNQLVTGSTLASSGLDAASLRAAQRERALKDRNAP